MGEQVYRPRRPKESPLWQCLCAHFYDFIQAYPEKYEKKYGFLKPVVEDVVNNYLDCGDLAEGFARIYCENCKKSMLLPFSCMRRWWRLPRTVPEGLWCGARHATRRRCCSSVSSLPAQSPSRFRTVSMSSACPSCCGSTSATTASS